MNQWMLGFIGPFAKGGYDKNYVIVDLILAIEKKFKKLD